MKYLTHPTWNKTEALNFIQTMLRLNSEDFLETLQSEKFTTKDLENSGISVLMQVQKKVDEILSQNQIQAVYEIIDFNGVFIHFENTFLKMKIFVSGDDSDSLKFGVAFWGQNVNNPFDTSMSLEEYLQQNFIPVLADWNNSENHPLVTMAEQLKDFDLGTALEEAKIPFGDEKKFISLVEDKLEMLQSDDWEFSSLDFGEEVMFELEYCPTALKEFNSWILNNLKGWYMYNKSHFNFLKVIYNIGKDTDDTMKLICRGFKTVESEEIFDKMFEE